MKTIKLNPARVFYTLVFTVLCSTAIGQNWTPQDKENGLIPTPDQTVDPNVVYPNPSQFFVSSFTDCYIPHDPNIWTQSSFINNGSGGGNDDDGSDGPISLPFDFEFYGTT